MRFARGVLARAALLALSTLSAVTATGCGGGEPAKTPTARADLAGQLAGAFREEAVGAPDAAVLAYLRTLDIAATSPDHPLAVPTLLASLDALVHRNVTAFATTSTSTALVDRTSQAELRKKHEGIDERLAQIHEHADGPFAPALIANARLALAERRGDARGAEVLRARSGCAREATLLGPLDWTPVNGVKQPDVFDRGDAPMPAELTGPGPFTPKLRPMQVHALGCQLPVYAQTTTVGVRDVVVDVDVPQAGWIGVGLRSPATATLRAGGKLAVDRPYALGPDAVLRLARVQATKGTLRLVARVGMDQDFTTVSISAWDEHGPPLRALAPAAGQVPTARAVRVEPVEAPAPRTDPERLDVALGALAAHEGRSAEALLHPRVADANAGPDLQLAYARAVRMARDLPGVKAQERARGAVDRVLEKWPNSWEAAIEHAQLAGSRRGPAEAHLEALADLDARHARASASAPWLIDAFEADVAGREHLVDRARAAFERARGALGGTPLLRDVERVAFDRTGPDAVAFECAENSPSNRATLGCHEARASVGDRAGAEQELERLRVLAGSPQLYLSLSSRSAVETGDLARARQILDRMNPADRTLGTVYAVKGKAAAPELLQMAVVARDAPAALPGLLRATGEDPLALYDGVAEKVVADPSMGTALANAATAVLAHDERYDVLPSGLVHFVMLDVRRVMGTTDVEANAQAAAPMLYAQETMRILRRRIFKKDGRVILPDQTPHASQSHADLSQLEAGDAVEAIYEGFGTPSEMGNVGFDTPDLSPERTALRDARIEVRLPRGLRTSLWSHPALGKPTEQTSGDRRVLVWHVENRPVRRLEPGIPKMDRSVCVSLSTTTWDDVARNLRDTLASLDADHPEVATWAKEAAGRANGNGNGKANGTTNAGRALVEAVVAAAGDSVKESSGSALADVDFGHPPGGQAMTARTVLATHEGSRTWLIVRALRYLGMPTEVVVAENEPFSDYPDFPPHFGRFMHPLAVAHVPASGDKPAEDVWIDADVNGPPLPAGRISPELRGRNALWPSGKIAPLPAVTSGSERDEVDIRLTVDEQGNAKGVLTALLRGRAAQDLSEALVRLVGLERQRALRGIALAWVPMATVDNVELSSSEGSWQVAIRADISAPGYAQLEGKGAWVLPGIDPIHYVFPRPYVSTLGSTYASHGARENALAINHATQYHVRRRVELPGKAQVARVPGPFEGKGPLLAAERKMAITDSSIQEDFTLELTTGTVPRDRYDAFVAEAHRTDDAFRASTRVKAPAP